MTEQLSALDSSFLRAESPCSHMHVAWRGRFATVPGGRLPILREVRQLVSARIQALPKLRKLVMWTPWGLGEPFWVDDPDFRIERHVVARQDAIFDEVVASELSRPLDRDLPLWRIVLVEDEQGLGLLCKMHHALVDGISAVQLGVMLLDDHPSRSPGEAPARWQAVPSSPLDRARRSTVHNAAGSIRGLWDGGRHPRRTAVTAAALLHTLTRVIADPASRSWLSQSIGPGRTLARATIPIASIRAIKRQHEVSFNDACLGILSAALADLPDLQAQTLKTMIPINLRDPNVGPEAGNQIAFAFVDLPVEPLPIPERLHTIHAQTANLKQQLFTRGTEALIGLLPTIPPPLKDRISELAGHPRLFDLTVSNIPGPPDPLYMLGTELQSAYPAVPITDGHALSIGLFSYREHVHVGLYADPDAFPDVQRLADAIAHHVNALAQPTGATTP